VGRCAAFRRRTLPGDAIRDVAGLLIHLLPLLLLASRTREDCNWRTPPRRYRVPCHFYLLAVSSGDGRRQATFFFPPSGRLRHSSGIILSCLLHIVDIRHGRVWLAVHLNMVCARRLPTTSYRQNLAAAGARGGGAYILYHNMVTSLYSGRRVRGSSRAVAVTSATPTPRLSHERHRCFRLLLPYYFPLLAFAGLAKAFGALAAFVRLLSAAHGKRRAFLMGDNDGWRWKNRPAGTCGGRRLHYKHSFACPSLMRFL